jgi:hypothetical protein
MIDRMPASWDIGHGFKPSSQNLMSEVQTGKTAGQRYANRAAATRSAATAKLKPVNAKINKYENALEESLKRLRNRKSYYAMNAARLSNAATKAATNAAVKAAVHATMKNQKPLTIGYRTHMSGANMTKRILPKVLPKVEKATEKAVETIMDKFVKKIENTHNKISYLAQENY